MKKSAQYFWNDLMYFLQSNTKNTADYNIAVEFLKRIDDIPYAKIEEFAHFANVTPSTITKFCKKLGFEGYNELKEGLAEMEEIETQIETIRKNYKKEQYEDAFLIYDSRMTTLFFEDMRKSESARRLHETLIKKKNICIVSPDYTANAIISFARTCRAEGINCLKLSRKTDPDLMIELTKTCDLLIVVSSTGKWLEDGHVFLNEVHRNGLETFVVGANTMKEFLEPYPHFDSVVISDELLLLNSHYNSSRLYTLFFTFIALKI